MDQNTSYAVHCANCKATFDALPAEWCNCLVTERSLICPHCGKCFCKAAPAYKQAFWSRAPRELWDRKFAEHHGDFARENPSPEEALRPLVLLVDDEKDIRRVACRVIDSLGYGLVMAKDGAEGLALAKQYRPDLVLSDALMPKLDGREMCRRLKEDPDMGPVKVVVMTALYTNARYRTEAFRQYRVDDYLAKPIDLESLRDMLQRYLAR